jgi:hypothetical protein
MTILIHISNHRKQSIPIRRHLSPEDPNDSTALFPSPLFASRTCSREANGILPNSLSFVASRGYIQRQNLAPRPTHAGGGILLIHWTGVDPKGKPVDIRYVLRYDGKKYAFPSDVTDPQVYISWKRISPSKVAFIDWSTDGKMEAENTRSVSADGKTMVQSTTALDANGQKATCTDRQVFERP